MKHSVPVLLVKYKEIIPIITWNKAHWASTDLKAKILNKAQFLYTVGPSELHTTRAQVLSVYNDSW